MIYMKLGMITYNGVNLAKILNSVLSALEVVYVAEGLKPCCRVAMKPEHYETLKRFCESNGLTLKLSDYKIIELNDINKGAFSNSGAKIPVGVPGGSFHAYISQKKQVAVLAKHFDSRGCDPEFGKLLGYPGCCIEFFERFKKQAAGKQFDFVLLASGNEGVHPFHNNYALRYFGISLIGHFPCSLDCVPSKEQSKACLDFMKKKYPETAQFFEEELKSFVLYTETRGVFYSHNYHREGGTIQFDSLNGTVKNDIFTKLSESKSIRIVSNEKFQIGDMMLQGDVGLLLFG